MGDEFCVDRPVGLGPGDSGYGIETGAGVSADGCGLVVGRTDPVGDDCCMDRCLGLGPGDSGYGIETGAGVSAEGCGLGVGGRHVARRGVEGVGPVSVRVVGDWLVLKLISAAVDPVAEVGQ